MYNLRVVLSDRCNYRCVFCSHDFNKCKNTDIDADFLEDCVKIFAGLGGQKITYTGGEPLIYSSLYHILRLSKSLNLRNAITTNGSRLKFQTEEFFSLVDFLNISIPSFIPSEYQHITCSSTSLSDIIDSAVKASEKGLRVKINTVYTGQDAEIISDMAGKFSEHGIIIKLMNDMIAGEEYYLEFLSFVEKYRNDSRIEIESAKNPGLSMCSDCKILHPTGCPSCHSIWVYPDKRITLCPFDNTAGNDDILERMTQLMNS